MSSSTSKRSAKAKAKSKTIATAAPSHRPASKDAIIVYDFEGEAVKGKNDAGTQVGSKGVTDLEGFLADVA